MASLTLKHTLLLKSWFHDTDTNILRMFVHLLLVVYLSLKLYFTVSYLGIFVYTANGSKYKCFTLFEQIVSLKSFNTFKIVMFLV